MSEEQIKKEINLLNDGTAKYLDKIDFNSTWSVAHWMRFLMFARIVTTHNVKNILDVGFGENVFVKYLEDAGFKGTYNGIDLNERYVTQATNPDTQVKTSFPTAFQLLDLKETTGMYDCIVMGELIEHLEKKEVIPFLKLAFNKLEMGGILIISTPNKIDDKINWPEDHYDEFTLTEVLENAIQAGFLVEDSFGLWNNSENTKKMLADEFEIRDYEKSVTYMPKALVNVLYNLRAPYKSRQVMVVLVKK